jgi:hypothetical protein
VGRRRKPQNDADTVLILYGIVAMCIVVVLETETNYPDWMPAALLGGLLLWLTIYHLLRNFAGCRVIFGILQTAAGLSAFGFQFLHRHDILTQRGRIDCLFFICGGIAALGNGVRDIDEGILASAVPTAKIVPRSSRTIRRSGV